MEKLLLLAAAMCFCGMVCADEQRLGPAEETADVAPPATVNEVAEIDNYEMGGVWRPAKMPEQIVYGAPIKVVEATVDLEDLEIGQWMTANRTAASVNGVAPIARSVSNW